MHERVHAKESAWVQAHTNKRERDRQGIGLRDIPNECLGFAGEIFNLFFQILALIVEFLADLIEVGVLCFESFDFLLHLRLAVHFHCEVSRQLLAPCFGCNGSCPA